MENEGVVQDNKPTNKRKLIIIIGVAAIVIIIILMFVFSGKKVDDYKQYIGKHYRDLPSSFSTEDLSDYSKQATEDKTVKFAGLKGKVSFEYFISSDMDETLEGLGFNINELRYLSWTPDDINNDSYEKIKKYLEKQYGEYDDFETYPDEDAEYELIYYIWSDIDGEEIDLGYKIDNADEILDIWVNWTDADDTE